MPPAINSAVSVCKFLATYFSLYMVIGILLMMSLLSVCWCWNVRNSVRKKTRDGVGRQYSKHRGQVSCGFWVSHHPGLEITNIPNLHISRVFQHVGICCFRQHIQKAFSLIFSLSTADSPSSWIANIELFQRFKFVTVIVVI